MKKNKLVSLVMLGMSAGILLLSGCEKAKGQEEMNPEMKSFYEQLSPDAQKKFMELDQEHKLNALQIVESYCRTESECKGHRERAVEEQYQLQMQQRHQMKNGMAH